MSWKTILQFFISPLAVAILMLFAQYFLQPLIQKKITSSNELWLNKKEILVKSIDIAYRYWDSEKFDDIRGNHITISKPSSSELNQILSGLYLSVDNQDVITKFTALFSENISPGLIGDYIKSVRKELNQKELTIPSDMMMGFYNTESIK